MGNLREQLNQEMALRDFSIRTRQAYLFWVEGLVPYTGRVHRIMRALKRSVAFEHMTPTRSHDIRR